MGFGDLNAKAGQKALNDYLADKSYIEGYQPSQADHVVFQAVGSAPSTDLAHALRWYNHILSYGNDAAKFVGVKKPLSAYGPPTTAGKPSNTGDDDDDDDDDDDMDLFGSDTEEDKAAAEKVKQERLAAYQAKKSKKPAVVAKSNIILDVKPWDDETDLVEMERLVRTIQKDGLLWGASKLVPLAYGIKKLQISCVVEDDKVSTDDLEEAITKFEDFVQSIDIAAFNKV